MKAEWYPYSNWLLGGEVHALWGKLISLVDITGASHGGEVRVWDGGGVGTGLELLDCGVWTWAARGTFVKRESKWLGKHGMWG